MSAPRAEQRPHVHVDTVAGEVLGERPDPYHWLSDREDPAVLAHLEAENAHTQEVLEPTRALQEQLFAEIRGRVVEDDASVPVPSGPYEYYHRTQTGKEHPIHCRRPRGGGAEEVLLDENELAAGSAAFDLGALEPSPDHTRLLYSVDRDGSEVYTLTVVDLATSDVLLRAEAVAEGGVWGDDETVLYTRHDDAMRPHQVWRQRLGAEAELVHQEDDESFYLGVVRSRDGWCVSVEAHSKTTSEVWYVRTDELGVLRPLTGRTPGVEHTVTHHRDRRSFLVTTNESAPSFRLMEVEDTATDLSSWTELVAEREGTRLEGASAFAGGVVLSVRSGGGTALEVLDPGTGGLRTLPQDEDVASVWLGANDEFETTSVRYRYTSMVTPTSTYQFDLTTLERTLLKAQPVPGYSRGEYETFRVWAAAPDGTNVPATVVRRRDTPEDGTAPGLVYAYGSYEASMDPWFSPARLSLLDRGGVFAVAHVRGGGEMGRTWWEDGHLEHKRNTFTDTVAVTEALGHLGIVAPGRVALRGGSAGGLLVGATLNLRPELYAAAVAEVPFVDVTTTMRDEELPLTVLERDEWGDPLNDPSAYETITSYSPYDNVRSDVPYPPLLVTAGLHDPRVGYWEPTKWVARLRDAGADVLLKVELKAGHGGPTGRYDVWRDEAEVLAFVLTRLGVAGSRGARLGG